MTQTNPETELLPCPFCSGEAGFWESTEISKLIRVGCWNCDANTEYESTAEKAAEHWNRRPANAEVEKLVAYERMMDEVKPWSEIRLKHGNLIARDDTGWSSMKAGSGKWQPANTALEAFSAISREGE